MSIVKLANIRPRRILSECQKPPASVLLKHFFVITARRFYSITHDLPKRNHASQALIFDGEIAQSRDRDQLPRTSINDHGEPANSYHQTVPTGSLFGSCSGAHILPSAVDAAGPTTDFQSGSDNSARALPKPLKELPKLPKRQSAKDSDTQFSIPPRKMADDMLNSYWDYVDSAYPWLDRASIERAYETLWTKHGEASMNERALHCILNLMFAASCVASQGESLVPRYESSGVFFGRAQQLMSCELMSIYNFEIIQILLLTAVYLQHERVPQKCFRNIAMAIHIAQELGLHLPETTEAISDPRERNLARQVWNGCIIMDRYVAIKMS